MSGWNDQEVEKAWNTKSPRWVPGFRLVFIPISAHPSLLLKVQLSLGQNFSRCTYNASSTPDSKWMSASTITVVQRRIPTILAYCFWKNLRLTWGARVIRLGCRTKSGFLSWSQKNIGSMLCCPGSIDDCHQQKITLYVSKCRPYKGPEILVDQCKGMQGHHQKKNEDFTKA